MDQPQVTNQPTNGPTLGLSFSCEAHLRGVIEPPVTALKKAPHYFRAMKPQYDTHPKSGTIKRCVPFVEALSAGAIIPLWADLYVHVVGDEIAVH